MKIFRLTAAFLILFAFTANSQNIRIGGDGTSTADPSAILELDGANSQGMLVPQMTEAQRNAFGPTLGSSANNGEAILIYQTDGDAGLYYWEGARWMKYKPYGFTGVVGTNWDTITDMYQFGFEGTSFTGVNLGLGSYEVNFSAPFSTYPTITMTPEANKFPLPDDLPVPDVTCTPSFTANCTADFNSDQCEAVRIVSTVDIASAGGTQTQVIQNGVGFLPSLNSPTVPTGYTSDTSVPEFVSATADGNGCSWPQSWMTGAPALSTGNVPAGANNSLLAGGCWAQTTDCILQVSDPCVVQDGGGNYGRYLPDGLNATVNSFCNNIYHPAETTNGTPALDTQQDNQVSIRIGNGASDHFEIYVESSPHWSDAMSAFIDWNRDGDFGDTGEFLGQINPPPCAFQGNPTSGCNGAAQLGPHAQTSAFIQNATPGQFTFPSDPSIAVDYGLTNLRIISTWTGGTASNPTLWDEPCRTSTWGETEDYIVEIYDDVTGSVVGLGNDFSYTPTICGISQVLGTAGNYTGFRVECTSILGLPIDTKVHFDVTKNAIY